MAEEQALPAPLPGGLPVPLQVVAAHKKSKNLMNKLLLGKEEEETAILIDKFWAEQKLEEKEESDEYPSFFTSIQFAKTSGLTDVPNLWDADSPGGESMPLRWFYALLLVFFVIYNLYYLISTDVASEWQICFNISERFLLSRSFIRWVAALAGVTFIPETVLCHGARLVGYFEFLGLVVLLIRGARNGWIALCPHCASGGDDEIVRERKRWFAHVGFFLHDLPAISAYSGMRLLEKIQPSIVSLDIMYIVYSVGPDRKMRAWIMFLVTRTLCLVIGFDMFLVKFRALQSFSDSTSFSFTSFLNCFLFIKQVLGIIKIDLLVQNRLFTFIFGGEDATVEPNEEAKALVWQAMIVRQIWDASRAHVKKEGKGRAWLKYMIVMLSYSDYDIQKLVLEPKKSS